MAIMYIEDKATWLAALRSKKYKQGRYMLQNPKNEFCCLGVLDNELGKSQWDEDEQKLRGTQLYNETYNLSYPIQNLLAAVNDGATEDNIKTRCALANVKSHPVLDIEPPLIGDFSRASFESIANWVEENL